MPIDLTFQVQDELPVHHGGTSNLEALTRGVISGWSNETGVSISSNRLVKLHSTYQGHLATPTTVQDERPIGLVLGTLETDGTITRGSVSDGTTAAVLHSGLAYVGLSAAVTRGDYAYASSTAGLAYGSATLSAGAFGVFLTDGTTNGEAEVLLIPTGDAGGVAHAILSATHADAATATVQRGDLISGQGVGTVQWDRRAKGTGTTDQYLGMAGSADPQWTNRYYGADAVTSSASNTLRGQIDLRPQGRLGLSVASNTISLAVPGVSFDELGGTLTDGQHGTRGTANPHSISAGAASEYVARIKLTADTLYRLTLGLDSSGLAQLVFSDGSAESGRLYFPGGGPIIAVGASDVLDLGPGQLYLPDGATLDAAAGAVRLSDATAGDEHLEVYAGSAARSIDLRGDMIAFPFSLPSSAFVATGTVTMRFGAGVVASGAFDRQPVPWGGSIVGVSVRASSARTGGTLDIEAVNNGVASGFMARLDASNTTLNSASQVAGLDTFAANGTIGAQIITAGWTPDPVNVYGAVYFLLNRV